MTKSHAIQSPRLQFMEGVRATKVTLLMDFRRFVREYVDAGLNLASNTYHDATQDAQIGVTHFYDPPNLTSFGYRTM